VHNADKNQKLKYTVYAYYTVTKYCSSCTIRYIMMHWTKTCNCIKVQVEIICVPVFHSTHFSYFSLSDILSSN